MPISEARKKANAKYNKKAYERINLVIKKGNKSTISSRAEENGESVNGFIKRAIKELMKRETGEDIDL